MTAKGREKQIARDGLIGILTNLLLAGGKLTVGLLSHSIAIVLDAVNNGGDVLSSLITVAGVRFAGRPADKEHPWGHGRYEYLSAMIISAVILYAGVTALGESVKKLLHPEQPAYTALTLAVVAAATAVKILLGLFCRKEGKRLDSGALTNSGKDALLDAAVSTATLAAALIYRFFSVNLEGWLGLAISGIILWSGVDMFRQTVSKILGERIESDLARGVKETVCRTEGVFGAYDLVLNSYGPGRWMGSVSIEVPDVWTADRIDAVSREISRQVAKEHGVILSAIGIYSRNTANDAARELRSRITEAVLEEPYVLQLHGFYCDVEQKTVRFDVVTDFLAPDPDALCDRIREKVHDLYPDYAIQLQRDLDFSD